jgi:hypothetical protein
MRKTNNFNLCNGAELAKVTGVRCERRPPKAGVFYYT